MNTDNINKTIALLKRVSQLERTHGRLFDMTVWGENLPVTAEWLEPDNLCGTVGCIAGWACVASGNGLTPFVTEVDPFVPAEEFPRLAAEFLELPEGLAQDLFCPGIGSAVFPGMTDRAAAVMRNGITAEDAIKVLEILRDTGEVRWSEVLPRDPVQDEEDG